MTELTALIAQWRERNASEYLVWRSGGDEKYRWRSSTLAQCADELEAALSKSGADHSDNVTGSAGVASCGCRWLNGLRLPCRKHAQELLATARVEASGVLPAPSAEAPAPRTETAYARLVKARNGVRDAMAQLRGGHATTVDDADRALAELDIAIGQFAATTTTARSRPTQGEGA